MTDQNTADVLNQDGPNAQVNAEELENAAANESGEPNQQANANEADDETSEGGKRLGGWQRKIKKLEEQNAILIDSLRKVGGNATTTAQTGSSQQTAEVEDKPPVRPARPKQSDFNEWDKWEAAQSKFDEDLDKYYEDKLAFELKQGLKQTEATQQKKTEQQETAGRFASQIAEAETEFKDFKEVAFNPATPMTPAMADAILASAVGARIAYELGQKQAEAVRISKLPWMQQIKEIGKIESHIESRIAAKKSAGNGNEDEEEIVSSAASSRAQRPPSTVRRPLSSPTELDDSLPYKEWERRRNAQLKRT